MDRADRSGAAGALGALEQIVSSLTVRVPRGGGHLGRRPPGRGDRSPHVTATMSNLEEGRRRLRQVASGYVETRWPERRAVWCRAVCRMPLPCPAPHRESGFRRRVLPQTRRAAPGAGHGPVLPGRTAERRTPRRGPSTRRPALTAPAVRPCPTRRRTGPPPHRPPWQTLTASGRAFPRGCRAAGRPPGRRTHGDNLSRASRQRRLPPHWTPRAMTGRLTVDPIPRKGAPIP